MIEQRKLTSEELDMLLMDAPDSERRGLISICQEVKMTPHELFKRWAFDWDGIVDNGRPIYVAAVIACKGKYELWTVVNSNVNSQIALFRCAKKGLRLWSKYIPEIYATMMKSWEKNRAWTERLGFKPCKETADTITYVLKQER